MVNPSRLAEVLEEEGFEVEYSPETNTIKVKGEVKNVEFFGVQEIVITNGKKSIYYSRYNGDNFIEIADNDEDDDIDDVEPDSIYLGRDLEVIVRYLDGYLIIMFPGTAR